MNEGQELGIESEESGFRRFVRRFRHEAWEIIKVLAIAAVIVVPIRYFIAQPFIVRGASMEPNFKDREYLIVDEISYLVRAPKRGEAIVFRYPRDPHQFFIKRIIGLPGEKVEVRHGRVKIFNAAHPEGFILNESYLVPQDRSTYPDGIVLVDAAEFYVLGDNRDASSDSRFWGLLGRKLIVGRALFRAWPLTRFGMVPDWGVAF